MTIRDIAVAFGFDIDRKSEKEAENSIKGLKNLATKLLGVIGIGFSIVGLSNLAEAAADAEALKSQFTQVFGEVESDATDKLQAIADDTGVMVSRMKGSFTQIAAFSKTAGVEQAEALDIANRSMIAVADSAAFYDRSIEDMTNSLQSFLKGNFENDAALGLSCTETTRNTAANNLYGKSFKDLSEAEKQFTLLSMVEEANKASGALGQAARESDTWTNQLGNLKQTIQDLKATAGSAFLQPAVMVLKLLVSLVQGVTAKIQSLTGKTGIVTRAFGRFYALIKRLKPEIFRMGETLQKGIQKGITVVKGMIDRFGGLGNVLKLLAVIAGSFLAVMAFAQVISGVKALITALKAVDKVMAMAKLKVLAIVAVVVILALIVEDFINFLMGNDSVIGTIFDKAGIGADNVRQAIFNAWTKIKEFLLGVWDFIRQAAGMFADTVKGFFERHGESIRRNFERAWGTIKTFLNGVWTIISQLAATLFGDTGDSIDGSTQSTKDKLLAVWQAILDALSAVWDALYEVGSAVFNAIATVIETVFGWIQSFWNSWGSRILAWFRVLWNSIGGILSAFLDIVTGVANFISSVFTGDWQGAWDAIKQIFTGIWDAIVSYITAVWDTIKMLFEMALAAIKAVWEAAWGAISGFFQGIWNGIVGFISGIWANITGLISGAITSILTVIQTVLAAISNVFHSVFDSIASFVTGIFSNILNGITGTIGNIKDTVVNGINAAVDFIRGLPPQAVRWGADFIRGLKDGILSGVQGIVDAVKGIGDRIKSFLHFSVPDEGPLTDYESWMPDFMGGLAEGIENSQDLVLDKVRNLAGGISALMGAAKADAGTAAASTVNNSSSSVTQNVNIENSYSGGTAETQKNVSRAMKKSASDATAQMARGLAYARG